MRNNPDLFALNERAEGDPARGNATWSVLICLLGNFRMLKAGQPVPIRNSGKTQALLASLALEHDYAAPRETLLQTVWPNTDKTLARQSLNSLVHSLRKQLSDQLGGAAPVMHLDGYYRLNVEAGIGVDVAWFCSLVNAGEQHTRSGHATDAIQCYSCAVRLYRGDLCATSDIPALIEREHLRAQYLSLLARLADHHLELAEYDRCLEYVRRLLTADPCREDAHRIAMRCYARRGERTQALRQYQVCETMLRTEFDVAPEPATHDLYQQLRLSPASV